MFNINIKTDSNLQGKLMKLAELSAGLIGTVGTIAAAILGGLLYGSSSHDSGDFIFPLAISIAANRLFWYIFGGVAMK